MKPLVDVCGTQLYIDRRLLQAELTVASRMWHSHCQTQYKNKDAPTITEFQQLLTKIHVAFPNLLKMCPSGFDITSNIIDDSQEQNE